MPKPQVDMIVVDAELEDGKQDTTGATQYENVEFLVVEEDKLHVWVNDTHYLGAGKPDTVEEGDVFYHSLPEQTVMRVESVDASDNKINIEYLYPAAGRKDTVRAEKIVGVPPDQQSMGYTGPPELLREPSTSPEK